MFLPLLYIMHQFSHPSPLQKSEPGAEDTATATLGLPQGRQLIQFPWLKCLPSVYVTNSTTPYPSGIRFAKENFSVPNLLVAWRGRPRAPPGTGLSFLYFYANRLDTTFGRTFLLSFFSKVVWGSIPLSPIFFFLNMRLIIVSAVRHWHGANAAP